MAKKIFAVVLGFVLAPAFITASHQTSSIVGDTCLVRVYHTNFSFPPEGGRIVQLGNEMFFWKTYLPECANRLPHNTAVTITPYMGTSNPVTSTSIHGSLGSQIVNNPCAVRVYHTNFQLPAEGGKIVQMGNEMFFVKSYLPECAGVGSGGTVLSTNSAPYTVTQTVNNGVVYDSYSANHTTPIGTVRSASAPNCY